MNTRFVVDESMRMIEFLRRELPGWKRTTLEQKIRAGFVQVNGAAVRRNDVLAVGDEVIVGERPARESLDSTPLLGRITLLHDDDDLIAIDKPAGLLSVSTDREKLRSALALVRSSLERAGKPSRLWPVHRLDRESSGVLLFAKSREARDAVQLAWPDVQKVYLAIVEGRPDPERGIIDEPLWEDQALNVRVGSRPGAEEARTRYATLKSFAKCALLEVELDTGRRHQIRAHLAWLGHPIVGDPRYGSAAPRMGLHALRLVVPHPMDGHRIVIESAPPKAFTALAN